MLRVEERKNSCMQYAWSIIDEVVEQRRKSQRQAPFRCAMLYNKSNPFAQRHSDIAGQVDVE